MSAETAKLVAILIASVEVVVWLAALMVMLRTTRQRQDRARIAVERLEFAVSETVPASTIVGEANIPGRPEVLSETLASILVRDGLGPIGPVKILGRTSEEVLFDYSGQFGSAPGKPRQGRIRLSPEGSRTRLDYAVETPSGRVLMGVGWIFIGLGGLGLFGGVWYVFAEILTSANPAIRTQAIQLVQCIHFLWPPFLFARQAEQPARFLRERIDSLLHNLPYA